MQLARRFIFGAVVAVPILAIGAMATWILAGWAAGRTQGDNLAAWIQAVGSIAALLLAGATLWVQRVLAQADKAGEVRDLAHSIDALARTAFERLTDRLKVAVKPGSGPKLELREYRTTEMIQALREIDVTRLPPDLIEPYVLLRSTLYAVNRRIKEVYAKGDAAVLSDLDSAVRIHIDAESAVNLLNERCGRYGIHRRAAVIPGQIEGRRLQI